MNKHLRKDYNTKEKNESKPKSIGESWSKMANTGSRGKPQKYN